MSVSPSSLSIDGTRETGKREREREREREDDSFSLVVSSLLPLNIVTGIR
jgi:hypothetical protein